MWQSKAQREVNVARNEEMYALWKEGMLMQDIARKYDMCKTNVTTIFSTILRRKGVKMKKKWHPIEER